MLKIIVINYHTLQSKYNFTNSYHNIVVDDENNNNNNNFQKNLNEFI
jgi:hypothetical protein